MVASVDDLPLVLFSVIIEDLNFLNVDNFSNRMGFLFFKRKI